MGWFVLGFDEIGSGHALLAGGKAANLGELSRIAGIRVPAGFCVSTDAFRQALAQVPGLDEIIGKLRLLKAGDREAIAEQSATIRSAIEGIPVPAELAHEITEALPALGAQHAYAIRSSATAEDLPTASFAGQQDTFLNVIGKDAILGHIVKCWASLFTERAVAYRMQNGFDHRKVQLAVVVQQMVFPQVSGIAFTADPLTSNRRVVSIDAGFGLGEALVSGLVNADVYKVREGRIIDKKIAMKKLRIDAGAAGGTEQKPVEKELQDRQALTDAQILQLEQLCRKIEAHFGKPQDIEWCLAGNEFYILQSRPITTLYPVPELNDGRDHVYLSVAHQQMMTDAMKPLGWSLWQMTTARPMYEAGGRLFVDIAQQLAVPASRNALLKMMGEHDPLLRDALDAVVARSYPDMHEKDDNKDSL